MSGAARRQAPAERVGGPAAPDREKRLVGVGARDVLGRFRVDAHDAVGRKIPGLAVGPLVLAAHRATQAAIKIGVRLLEITDDFEVDALDLRQIDLLDVNETKQLADGLWHLAPAFVTRTATLRDTDLGPELLLVQSQAAPDLTRIKHSVEEFHELPARIFKDGNAIQPTKGGLSNTIGIIVD